MEYTKNLLSGLAAAVVALIVVWWPMVREMAQQKQTGLGAMTGAGAMLLSPVPWLVFAICAITFFRASSLRSKPLRISLFWVPAITLSTLGGLVFGLWGAIIIFLVSKS